MLDQHLYPVVTSIVDGELIIKKMMRQDFRPNRVSGKWVMLLKFPKYHQLKCFISGVQCYIVDKKMYHGTPLKTIPWAASHDHLCPVMRGINPVKIQDGGTSHTNLCVVGAALNSNMGHIPLALKLLHRQTLANNQYDREDFSFDNFLYIRKTIIDTEDRLRIGGLYPWQPWTYPENKHKKLADDFCKKLYTIEDEYLRLGTNDAMDFINNFKWNL
jgi:hypothetical protein